MIKRNTTVLINSPSKTDRHFTIIVHLLKLMCILGFYETLTSLCLTKHHAMKTYWGVEV